MSWQTEMTTLLRYTINDSESPQEYTDARLQTLIVVAAQLMLAEVDFSQGYIVSIGATGIAPDPTQVSPKDNAFINLTVLKARCILAQAEARKAGQKALSIKDGPSAIDGGGVSNAAKAWMTTACLEYEQAEFSYRAGDLSAGRAIVGPHMTDIMARGTMRDRPEFN